ncbi:MAG: GDP-mannose 4,6-dehydratase [Candidatus Altiarchaeota archaeon]
MEDRLVGELRDRTILVTGADGFMGSHLTEKLVEYGSDVHVFIRATSSGEMKNIGHLLRKVKVHRGDLADPLSVRLTIRRLKAEAKDKPIIFHLGAQAHVGESWQRPYETFQANTIGTLNILQSVVDEDLDLLKMDFAGTSEEFGNMVEEMKDLYTFNKDGIIIFNERSPINPESPYAVSKVAGDFLCKNFYNAYGVPTVITRMFNNYGPRQSPRYVTGTIITQALNKKEVLLGALKPTRDFTYVLDGVRGHIYATLKGKPGQTYSYGYGKDISIGDWAKFIIECGQEEGYWGTVKVREDKVRYRPGKTDLMRLGVDYTKMRRETGWIPRHDRRESVKETIKYYAENKDKWWGRIDW